MDRLLSVYHMAASRPGLELSTQDLVAEGFSPNYARVALHRLQKAGVAVSLGKSRVRILPPGERAKPLIPATPPWKRSFHARFTVKETGFSVLPHRYPTPRPDEFVVPSMQLNAAAQFIRQSNPQLRVHQDGFHAEGNAVCLYPGPVQRRVAATEDALLHVFRHAPRDDFALAMQAVLVGRTDLNWSWFRRQPEWPEIAGIFVAANEMANRQVFPNFRTSELPSLSWGQIGTITQPFTARGN